MQLKTYFRRHLQVFFYTLGHFSKQKVGTALSILALGIGLSIPAVLFTLADSLSSFGEQWQSRPQISLYLRQGTTDEEIKSLKGRLEKDALIETTQFISAEQGWADFNQHGAFEGTLDLFKENPLPDVLVLYPAAGIDLDKIQALTESYQQEPLIERAQYDLDWLKRLNAIETILKRVVAILAVIISVGLILLIANTIRLEIANRSDEIDTIDQLGGTASFIKRPFLYMGVLEGFFGGLCALLISIVVLVLLAAPVQRLSQLYGIELGLSNVSGLIALALLVVSSLLGWLAAQITLTQKLKALRPV